MGRIRCIHPTFSQSESMGRVSGMAQLTFVLLFTQSDDEGRLRGAPRMLASVLFPFHPEYHSSVPSWLQELSDEDCISCYMVGKNTYIQINNWLKYQKINRPHQSRHPPIGDASKVFSNILEHSHQADEMKRIMNDVTEGSVNNHGAITEQSLPDKEWNGMEVDKEWIRNGRDIGNDSFDEFFSVYPRQIARNEAEVAFRIALSQATAEEIIDGAKRYAASKPEPTFTLFPANWLGRQRWKDNYPDPPLRKVPETRAVRLLKDAGLLQAMPAERHAFLRKHGVDPESMSG